MPISGVLLTCNPQKCTAAAEAISALPGVEVHDILSLGRIVAVIEADDVEREVELVSRMHEIEGVNSVRLAYHNFEDL
ncbi:chaperone NapD [Geomonas sp.]|uniref:chaperone NapD n=1 Tax=Geomonas sp. TaxID=2651584 RepID=UPI002B45DCEF|nr:chaperone NapD [Geomonas sp.]HJV33604.1 chaperone NapD [Geomonas sp.]